MNKTINFNEKLECKGYWWLPNNPNKTIAGVLTEKRHSIFGLA